MKVLNWIVFWVLAHFIQSIVQYLLKIWNQEQDHIYVFSAFSLKESTLLSALFWCGFLHKILVLFLAPGNYAIYFLFLFVLFIFHFIFFQFMKFWYYIWHMATTIIILSFFYLFFYLFLFIFFIYDLYQLYAKKMRFSRSRVTTFFLVFI